MGGSRASQLTTNQQEVEKSEGPAAPNYKEHKNKSQQDHSHRNIVPTLLISQKDPGQRPACGRQRYVPKNI